MSTSALILIDIQNDYFLSFPDCKMPLPDMENAARNAASLLEVARSKDTRVVHIRHVAASAKAPFFHPGTEGSETNIIVSPIDGEVVIKKQRPNSFMGTNLEAVLRNANIENLTLCGAMSQMCIDATARSAVDLGFKVTIVHDACAAAGITHAGIEVSADKVHAAIMAPLASSYAKVVTTADYL
ncbi:MAG: cysteine hydrolase [Rhodobacteraceae bacterium]|nr:cysteine hydrolase [Paracoccaceae bacterium]